MSIEKLIKPESIAVIGVTDRKGAFGNAAAKSTIKSKNADRVYFVHIKREELMGKKCYKSLEELPEVVDCIILCTPRSTINGYIEEAGKMGTKAAVVYASGYSEEHTESGDRLEKEMKEIARKYGMSILGPNCCGIINNEDNINMWGLNNRFNMETRKCGIGIVAQSGFIAHNIVNKSFFNISYAVSSGNGNITYLEDFLDYMVDDDNVYVIAIYLEGVTDANKFTKALKKAAENRKPVVVLKTGKSAKGAAAAASHTGNLAGSAKSYDSVFEKFGVVSVNCLEELMCVCQMFSVLKGNFPEKATFAGVNLSGGENAICADLAEEYGLKLPDLLDETKKKMENVLPGFATPQNPLDGTTAIFRDLDAANGIIKALEEDPAISGIIVGANIGVNKLADRGLYKAMIGTRKKGYKKPIFAVPSFEATRNQEARDMFENVGIPLLSSSTIAFSSLNKLSKFIEYDYNRKTLNIAAPTNNKEGLDSVAFSEYDSKQEMIKYGVSVPAQTIAKTVDDLKNTNMKYPLVLKVNSPDILHKTEAGGVKLNIQNEEEAIKAFNDIMSSCKAYKPDAKIDGILVQEMASKGTEIIIGVTNDKQFGPMILVGLGGVFVEVFKDSVLYPCPLAKNEAIDILKKLKSYKLLSGYRGSKPCDIDALADIMVKISNYALENKDEIKEMDLNPVFVYPEGEGVAVVDALIVKYK